MKRFKKCVLCLLIVTFLAICVAPANAASVSAEGRVVTDTQTGEYVQDGKYIKYISKEALDAFRNGVAGLSTNAATDSKAKFLEQLGYEKEDLEAMGDDEIDEIIENGENITLQNAYYYTDAEGKTRLITREEYQRAKNQSKIDVMGNGGSSSADSADGYFNIFLSAVYLSPSSQNNEIGWYIFSGTFKFINGTPKYRMRDAASLAVEDVMWAQDSSEFFSTMTHKYYNHAGNELTEQSKKVTDKYMYTNGFYYLWDLPRTTNEPSQGLVHIVFDIRIYVRGKAKMRYYEDEQSFSLYARYEHTYSALSVQPSFSWTLGSIPGVSANVGVSNGSNTYTSSCAITYKPSSN